LGDMVSKAGIKKQFDILRGYNKNKRGEWRKLL